MTRYSNSVAPAAALAVAFALFPSIAAGQDVSPASGAADGTGLAIRTELDLSYECFLRSDNVLVEDYKHKSGIDLRRSYLDRAPLARYAASFGAPYGLEADVEATIRGEWTGDYFKADNLPPDPASGNPFRVDNYFVTKGVLYYRMPGLFVAFGRDKVDYGQGIEGSLYPSARLPYLDNARLDARIGPLTMNWMVASIQNRRNWEVYANGGDASYDVNPNDDGSGGMLAPPLYGFEDDPQATSVIEALHRFSWDFGKIDIGLGGHIMYARANNRFYLSDFFPVISWHQAEVLETNLSMILDVQYEPFEGLRIMAQGGFDDISADFAGFSDDATPTIPAYVVAARYEGRLGGGRLDAYLETGYTHWAWGSYDGSVMLPNTVDPLLRAQYRMLMVGGAALLPLTSPYGPGARWLESSCSWETPVDGLRIGLDLLVLGKNVDANLISTDYVGNATTPSARTILYSRASLPVEFRWKSLAVSAEPAACAKDGCWWLESTFMVGYRLRNSLSISHNAH